MKAKTDSFKYHHTSHRIYLSDTLDITSILLLTLLLVFSLLLLWQQRKGWKLILELNGWRGIFQQPLLWLLLLFNLEPKSILDTATNMRKYFQRPLAILIGTRLLLYIDDPETMEQVLNSHECLDKTFLQNGFFAKDGLLHARAQKWKVRRKQLNPAFSQNIVLSFFNIFNSVGNKLQQKYSAEIQYNTVFNFKDVEDLLSRAVLEVSCLTIMGTATNFTQEDENDIARTYKKLMELSAMKIIKPWLQCETLFRLLDRRNYDVSVQCNKLVQAFVNKIVVCKYRQWREEQHKQEMHAQSSVNGDDTQHNDNFGMAAFVSDSNFPDTQTKHVPVDILSEASCKKRIFIEQLFHLATMGELTMQDIMNEAESMVLVSFETISNSIITTLLLLAMHLECQQKLREEINKILPNGNTAEIGVTQLQQFKYLDMVVNESMRLLTTVPMNLRNVSREFQLKNTFAERDGVRSNTSNNKYIVVPQNTIIVLDTFNMQRDELFWGANAKKFQPTHFENLTTRVQAMASSVTDTEKLHKNAKNQRHPYAFIPFSKGLRTCIGGRYSLFMLKLFLIKLIAKFEFSTTTTLGSLRYVEGISLKFLHPEKIEFQIKPL